MAFVKCSKMTCRREAGNNKLKLCDPCWNEWDKIAGTFVRAITQAKQDQKARN